jgi:hypothetical protein
MARLNKQTSVKNRRMNPPRPVFSSRGAVSPGHAGKLGLQAYFFPAAARFGPVFRAIFFTKNALARLQKTAKTKKHSLERPAKTPWMLATGKNRSMNQLPAPCSCLHSADGTLHRNS